MKVVTAENFDSAVNSSDKLVIVDCYADWCAPCKVLKPTLEKLATEMKDTIELCGVDIEESPDIAKKYGIRGVPTLLWFKNGSLVGMTVGTMRKEQLVSEIKTLTE